MGLRAGALLASGTPDLFDLGSHGEWWFSPSEWPVMRLRRWAVPDGHWMISFLGSDLSAGLRSGWCHYFGNLFYIKSEITWEVLLAVSGTNCVSFSTVQNWGSWCQGTGSKFQKKIQAAHGPRPCKIMVLGGFSCLKLKRGIDFALNSVSRS